MERSRRSTLQIGAAVAVGALLIALIEAARRTDVLSDYAALSLNEKGDALGGIFAALAFLGTAIAILLQSRELSAQREELQLTRQELQASRIAQEKTASAQAISAEIFADEQRDRALQREDELLSRRLDLLAANLLRAINVSASLAHAFDFQWISSYVAGDSFSKSSPNYAAEIKMLSSNASPEVLFTFLEPRLVKKTQKIKEETKSAHPSAVDELAELIAEVNAVLESAGRASESAKIWIDVIGLQRFSDSLSELGAFVARLPTTKNAAEQDR